jgi:hypothetical protein
MTRPKERTNMSRVFLTMAMSLDGFITPGTLHLRYDAGR